MRWLYNLGLGIVAVALAPVWIALVLLSPKLRRDFGQRLRPLAAAPSRTVWLHAASVGEVEAAAPLLECLLAREIPVVVTTQTVTGRDRLRARLPGLRVRLMPLDLPGLVDVSLRRARISVLVLVETELWPNLIWAARRCGTEVIIVSGRLSDGSFPAYRRGRLLFRHVLRDVHVLARSEVDADRFRTLGAAAERTQVGGDLKLDRLTPLPPSAALEAAIGPGPFVLGASTHAGEEEALLAAWRALRAAGAPALRLLLAPRHVERADQVTQTLRRSGAEVGLRSEGARDRDVVVLDTLGELATLYSLAELVFVGGSLAPVGGHNLIEPVQAGKIVVHGPHIENQRHQEQLLRPLNVLYRVEDAADLGRVLGALWADPQRNALAEHAARAVASHRGASARALDRIGLLRETHA